MKKKTDNVHMARLGFVLAMVMFGAIGLFVRIGLPSSTIACCRGPAAFATPSADAAPAACATGAARTHGARAAVRVAMGFN